MPPLVALRRAWRDPARRRLGLLAALTLAITPIPGIGTLGYFSSLVLSLPCALAGRGVGVDAALRARDAGAHAAREGATTRLAASLGQQLAWVVGVPLAALVVGMLYNRNCDPWTGVVFHLLGPGLSATSGAAVGLAAGTLAATRRRAMVMASAVIGVSTAIGLARLYLHPCVYFMDPFWGWFSGPIYDEQVGVSARWLRFRGYNLLACAAVLAWWRALARDDQPGLRAPTDTSRRGSVALATVLTAAAAWYGLQPARHGFTTTRARTLEALPATFTTEHFVLHYAPRSVTAESVELIAMEHEFAWSELEQALGRAPEAPVEVFVYRSSDQKRRLFGVGGVEVSLPWKRSLYLTASHFPIDVVHHELAHTFGGPFGDPLLGLSIRWFPTPRLNFALIEGFAVALAPRSRFGLDIHDQAAALHALGLRPSLAGIMGVGFYGQSSSRAYTAAGSFVRWLAQTRGTEVLGRLYTAAGDVEVALGAPLEDLETEWIAFLEARLLEERVIASLEERFRRRSVFHRPCAHRVARTSVEAALALRNGDADEAIRLRQSLCEIEPDRLEHRASLARVHAVLGSFDAAIEVLDQAAALPAKTHTASLDAQLARLRGDVELKRGDFEAAAASFDRALALPTSDGMRRGLLVRRFAATHAAFAPTVADYFGLFEDRRSEGTARTLRPYLAAQLLGSPASDRWGHYLIGRQLILTASPVEAALHLSWALGRPTPPSPHRGPWTAPTEDAPRLPPSVRRAAFAALAEAELRQGHHEAAREVLRDWRAEATRSETPSRSIDGRGASTFSSARAGSDPRGHEPRVPLTEEGELGVVLLAGVRGLGPRSPVGRHDRFEPKARVQPHLHGRAIVVHVDVEVVDGEPDGIEL